MRSKECLYFIVGLLFACLPFACIAEDVVVEPAVVEHLVEPVIATPIAVDPAPVHVLTLEDAAHMSLENQPALRLLDSNNFANTTIRFINTDDPKLVELKTAVDNFRNKQDLLTQDILTLGDSLLPVELRIKVRYKRNRQVKHNPESLMLSREIARDAGLAWLRMYYARHAIVLEQAMLSEYADQIDAAKIAFRAGKGSQSDIWKAEDAFNAAREMEIELRNQAARAQSDLTRWIGNKPFTLAEKITTSAPPEFQKLHEKISGHPRQLMYWLAEEIADDEIRAVEDGYKPDPKIELHPEEPIMSALHALREKIGFQSEDSIRMLRSELSRAYTDWQFAQERYDLYEKSVAPNASRRLQATVIDYGNGKADFSVLLEARRYALEAKIELLQLQIAAAKARIQLGYYE
jgi:hypothetical protein